jgi:fatty-acyl-CoA synthase
MKRKKSPGNGLAELRKRKLPFDEPMNQASLLTVCKELKNVHDLGVRFVGEKGKAGKLSYAELISQSRRFASALRKRVNPGDPVILVMTEPRSAITAILGCMIAHCPPAPIYPPQNLKSVPVFQNFVKHVASRSKAALIISDPAVYPFLRNTDASPVRSVEKTSALQENSEEIEIEDHVKSGIAFLQFTSGSTSTPKGVMVMHDGLQANLSMIRRAAHMDEKSCVVTWLPVYHDMGLIGTVLNAITLPCDLVVLPPLNFLKHPRTWLELMTEFRGTHTAAPNFAFGLCVRRVQNLEGLNLSSMTTFICGAEPVLPKTMESFIEHFAAAGLRPGAIVPAYGLAEATLAVTFNPHMRGLIIDEIDLAKLTEERIASPAQSKSTALRIPSCGLPLHGLEVRIADEMDNALTERSVGEIQVRGPNVTPGYIGDNDATANSQTSDGWLKTGDLGYLLHGELYPCGRIKDVIIIRGKNYHAHDLETIASEVPGVRIGNVVAFAESSEKGEGLIVIAESRNEARMKDIEREIRSHLAQSAGITPDEVTVVPAGTLPKTSSGKLKRAETKNLYLRGELLKQGGKFAGLQAALKSGIGILKRR